MRLKGLLPIIVSGLLVHNSLIAQSLSDSEADAIIFQQEQAKATARAEREAKQPDFQVLSTTMIDQGDHVVVMERVAPPILPEATPKPEIQVSEPTPLLEAYTAEKEIVSMFLSGSVYGNEITEIRWQHEGDWVTAWSNVDFNHLRSVTGFDTPEAHYSFMMVMDNQPIEALESLEIRKTLKVQPEAAYLVKEEVPDAALIGLEALHDYYAANEVDLKADWERSESIWEARERYEAANPKEPEDVVIRYWQINNPSSQ